LGIYRLITDVENPTRNVAKRLIFNNKNLLTLILKIAGNCHKRADVAFFIVFFKAWRSVVAFRV